MTKKITCPHCGEQFEIESMTASDMARRAHKVLNRTSEDYAEMGRKGGKARNLSRKEASELGKIGARKRWEKHFKEKRKKAREQETHQKDS